MYPAFLSILFYTLSFVSQTSKGHLLAHGHLKKHIIDACEDPNHCQINPSKPLYFIWSAEHQVPRVKMKVESAHGEEDGPLLKETEGHRSFSIEMERPYRLDVWDRLSDRLKARVLSAFDSDNVWPHQVIITSIHLQPNVVDGYHTLWFINPFNQRRYETEIFCTKVRSFKHMFQPKQVCTWKK